MIGEKSGSYQERRVKAAEAWGGIRSKILPTIISGLRFSKGICIFLYVEPSMCLVPRVWIPCLFFVKNVQKKCINLSTSSVLWIVIC